MIKLYTLFWAIKGFYEVKPDPFWSGPSHMQLQWYLLPEENRPRLPLSLDLTLVQPQEVEPASRERLFWGNQESEGIPRDRSRRFDSTGNQIQGNHDLLILLKFLFLTVKILSVCVCTCFTHSSWVDEAELSLYHAILSLLLVTCD